MKKSKFHLCNCYTLRLFIITLHNNTLTKALKIKDLSLKMSNSCQFASLMTTGVFQLQHHLSDYSNLIINLLLSNIGGRGLENTCT